MNSSTSISVVNSSHTVNSIGVFPSFNYEILGFFIGIIALAIAIITFVKQERWNSKFETLTNSINDYNQHHKKIEDSIKEQSLKRLRARLNLVKHQFETLTEQLNRNPNLDELKNLINEVGFGKVFQTNSNGFQTNADTLKFLILSSFHNKIESLGFGLSNLSILENFVPFSNAYDLWLKRMNDNRQTISELLEEIEKELALIKN